MSAHSANQNIELNSMSYPLNIVRGDGLLGNREHKVLSGLVACVVSTKKEATEPFNQGSVSYKSSGTLPGSL